MIYESGLLSLAVQVITGAVDVYGLMQPTTKETKTLNQLLKIELGVQIIELAFYVWLIYNIKTAQNITASRYYDWFFTTPTMLITFIILLSLNPQANNIPSLPEFIKDNKRGILSILLLNAMMLLLGYLGELSPKSNLLYVFAGMIPFLAYFYKIYNQYVTPNRDKPSYVPRDKTFFYFFGIWSLYAVAALMPYQLKNTMYNILDLFAKNFLGVFLVYLIKTRA
jgi:bacteriorhodopsin